MALNHVVTSQSLIHINTCAIPLSEGFWCLEGTKDIISLLVPRQLCHVRYVSIRLAAYLEVGRNSCFAMYSPCGSTPSPTMLVVPPELLPSGVNSQGPSNMPSVPSFGTNAHDFGGGSGRIIMLAHLPV